MSQVMPGRYTAEIGPQGAVVFLIGMRFNQWWRVDRWWPVFTAMPRMLRYLAADPESGLLGYHLWFGRTVLVLQYWRSTEELIGFASDSKAPHAAAWREFNRRISAGGAVGVWHETYAVTPGHQEAVYVNMPRFGLAAATRHTPVGPGTGSARARLRRRGTGDRTLPG
ncbi:MAG TPA: DUF4188 domain-containing protein [Pseudonocardiaceae bacterium]|nr:DUF4188 domain-containing protein [Pseudonocardiaceae bacterium]